MEVKKDTRCAVKVPLDLMDELRKIKKENHTTIIGAVALLIANFRKGNKND